jgi:hypothetical protein
VGQDATADAIAKVMLDDLIHATATVVLSG